MEQTVLDAVCTGTVEPFGPGGEPSAIRKSPAAGRITVNEYGVEGDAHGDPHHHGGLDKAVHHYAFDHYPLWRAEFPEAAHHFERPAFFGENLSTTGITEATVCVGDIYRVGTALLQVSEVRQPCWKLAHRSGVRELPLRLQETGRTGWHYRVIETGVIESGDPMTLEERPQPQWTLARLLTLLYTTPLDAEGLRGMATLPELAAGQRAIAEARLSSGRVEPWARRVTVPGTEPLPGLDA
ncbi:MAG: MOSC domain-containing protein [Spirochaetota bacterium]